MKTQTGKTGTWLRTEPGAQVAGVLCCYSTACLQRAAKPQRDVRYMKQ